MQQEILIGRDVLETLTSSLYEDPIIIFREYVQNSLDAFNIATEDTSLKFDGFCVNIDIDQKNKDIVIKDNGYGIKDNFSIIMLRLGDSDKLGSKGNIGFRGIGRLSGLLFCSRLTFENKVAGEQHVDTCEWDGDKYRSILETKISKDSDQTVNQVISQIAEISSYEYKGNVDDHFFQVTLHGYNEELDETIKNINFKHNISLLLPIKYSKAFKSHTQIEDEYEKVMGSPLSKYFCPVFLNGEKLEKEYSEDNVLASGIKFWIINGIVNSKTEASGPIGLLWFTFDQKLSARKNDNLYGILIRSKNVLMGNNDTLANISSSSSTFVSTHRELVQTLRGVYGELLLDSNVLVDNARRDWFKPDKSSRQLKYTLIDFMEKLFRYRYASSRYFNSRSTSKSDKMKEENLREAYIKLSVSPSEEEVFEFCKREIQKPRSLKNAENDSDIEAEFSAIDMPLQSKTKQKIYDELIAIIKSFCEKENKYEFFIKMRAYIKQYYDKEE